MSEYELRQKVRKGEYSLPDGVEVSQVCRNMITSLIVLDASNRMSFQAFNDHPFTKLNPEEYQAYIQE